MLGTQCGRQASRHCAARRHAGAPLLTGAPAMRIHSDRRSAFIRASTPMDGASGPGAHAGDPRHEPASNSIDPRVTRNPGSEPSVSRSHEPFATADTEDQYGELQEESNPRGQLAVPGSWTALFMVPAAVWGACWFMTAGTSAGAYASLACAAAIARDAFGGLVASSGGAAAPGAAASAAAAAAAATVDWPDLAMRTAAGLAAGGAGSEQVLQALQDAGAHPVSSWAVQVVLPALCGLWRLCRSTALGLQEGPLGAVLVLGSQLGAVAAGLGVLLALALPLRPYLAPLLPIFPKARPTPATQAAVKAGGAACMVAILTLLQSSELAPPSLAPARGGLSGALPGLVPGSAAYGAAGLGGVGGSGPFWYSCVAVTGDVVVPLLLCGAAVAAAAALWGGRGLAKSKEADATEGREGRDAEGLLQSAGGAGRQGGGAAGVEGGSTTGAAGDLAAPAGALRRLGSVLALRAALDCVLLLLAATGQLGGRVSGMHVLGTLWLLQALWHLRQQPGTGAPAPQA